MSRKRKLSKKSLGLCFPAIVADMQMKLNQQWIKDFRSIINTKKEKKINTEKDSSFHIKFHNFTSLKLRIKK